MIWGDHMQLESLVRNFRKLGRRLRSGKGVGEGARKETSHGSTKLSPDVAPLDQILSYNLNSFAVYGDYLSSIPERDRARARAFFDYAGSLGSPVSCAHEPSAELIVPRVVSFTSLADGRDGYMVRWEANLQSIDAINDYFLVLATTPGSGRTGANNPSNPTKENSSFAHHFADDVVQYAHVSSVIHQSTPMSNRYYVHFLQATSLTPEVLGFIREHNVAPRLRQLIGDYRHVSHRSLIGRRAIDPDFDDLVSHIEGVRPDFTVDRSTSRSLRHIKQNGDVDLYYCVPVAAKDAARNFFERIPSTYHGKTKDEGSYFRVLPSGIIQEASFGIEWGSKPGYCWGDYSHYVEPPERLKHLLAGQQQPGK